MPLAEVARTPLTPSEYESDHSNPENYRALQLAEEAGKSSLERAFDQHEGLFIFVILITLVVAAAMLFTWLRKSALPKVKHLAASGTGVVTAVAHEFKMRNKVCPFCAETIKREATVCKHCLRAL